MSKDMFRCHHWERDYTDQARGAAEQPAMHRAAPITSAKADTQHLVLGASPLEPSVDKTPAGTSHPRHQLPVPSFRRGHLLVPVTAKF